MSGIIFFRTTDIEKVRRFYIDEVGMALWLDQGGCVILRHGNFLLGFCSADEPEVQGCITFYYDTEREVDIMYSKFEGIATGKPAINERYRIYNFFAKDPEGRTIEFQKFLNDVEPV